MKKVLSVLVGMFITIPAFATGDATPTSKGYVDAQMETLQDNLPGAVANTVVTTTATAGETGTKAIYDASGNYVDQQNALVTAEDANTAVQNAINNEFVCVEWAPDAAHTPENCYIWDIKAAKLASLPSGYTVLEYISSDQSECIITNITWGDVYGFNGRAQQTVVDSWNQAIFGSSTSDYSSMYGTYYESSTNTKYWYWVRSISYLDIAEFKFTRASGNYWQGTVNNVDSPNGNISVDSTDYVRLLCTNNINRWFVGNVWYLQLIDQNGNFLLNAIPVKRDSDGLVGLYDLVSGQMLTNSGTGTFVSGPVASYLPQGL